MEHDEGRIQPSQEEAAGPVGHTKGDGGSSAVFGAFFLAITLLIGTWTLLPQGKVDVDQETPASQLINTDKIDCASGSGGFKSSWNCQTQSTTTSH